MNLISWNLNGIKSTMGYGLIDFVKKDNADVYCFQEVKSNPEDANLEMIPLGYKSYWFPAEKKGYAGVMAYSKIEPLSIIKGLGREEFDKEGRVLTLEFENFFLVNAYFPHSQRELKRIDFKLNFNKTFLKFCEKLRKKKPVVIASDFNVAHKEIDLKNPKSNRKNAGFTDQEREWFEYFLNKGYVDIFREFEKEGGHYTWWSNRFKARERNIGWRVDYFIVSSEFLKNVKKSEILPDIFGSDHCPIRLVLSKSI